MSVEQEENVELTERERREQRRQRREGRVALQTVDGVEVMPDGSLDWDAVAEALAADPLRGANRKLVQTAAAMMVRQQLGEGALSDHPHLAPLVTRIMPSKGTWVLVQAQGVPRRTPVNLAQVFGDKALAVWLDDDDEWGARIVKDSEILEVVAPDEIPEDVVPAEFK